MRVSDKWNPRLWLKDWLNKPSMAELAERRSAEAAAAQMFQSLSAEPAGKSVSAGFILLADTHGLKQRAGSEVLEQSQCESARLRSACGP